MHVIEQIENHHASRDAKAGKTNAKSQTVTTHFRQT